MTHTTSLSICLAITFTLSIKNKMVLIISYARNSYELFQTNKIQGNRRNKNKKSHSQDDAKRITNSNANSISVCFFKKKKNMNGKCIGYMNLFIESYRCIVHTRKHICIPYRSMLCLSGIFVLRMNEL